MSKEYIFTTFVNIICTTSTFFTKNDQKNQTILKATQETNAMRLKTRNNYR